MARTRYRTSPAAPHRAPAPGRVRPAWKKLLVVQRPALGLEPPDQGGDLAGRKAPVPAQRLHVRKFLLRRPPRHRLGRYVEQRSNLLRKQILRLVRLDHSGPPLPDIGRDPHVPGDRGEYTRWAGACAAISGVRRAKKPPESPAASGSRRLKRPKEGGRSRSAGVAGTSGGATRGAHRTSQEFPQQPGGYRHGHPQLVLAHRSGVPPDLTSSLA